MRDYTHFLFYSCQITESSIILDHTETTHAVRVLRQSKTNFATLLMAADRSLPALLTRYMMVRLTEVSYTENLCKE